MPAKAKTRCRRNAAPSAVKMRAQHRAGEALQIRRCRRQRRSPHRRGPGPAPPVRATAPPGSSGHCRSRSRHPPPPATDPWRREKFWWPSSITMTLGALLSASLAPAARSRATMVGAMRASSSASSPTSGGAVAASPAAARFAAAIAAGEEKDVLAARAAASSAIAIATGVLPLPPAVRLPTQITGSRRSIRRGAARLQRHAGAIQRAQRRQQPAPAARAVCQNSGARMEQAFQHRDGAATAPD